MKFTEVLPSNIDGVWKTKTQAEFTGELNTAKDAKGHHMNTILGKTEILKRITKTVIARVGDPASDVNAVVETALLLAVRIGWDLREYMEARYQDADELERIVPDAELEMLLADMKRTGTAPALPKETK